MKKRSDLAVMLRLVGLVKPLMGFMALAIAMGVAGFLCAQFIPIFGGLAIVKALGGAGLPALGVLFACMGVFALARGVLRYAEQACNHYIAFKLLALIRDKVFGALRRLAPAKLDGRDKGDLIAVITSDIELLEVFYAHTLSPIAIAAIMSVIMTVFIGSYHWLLGLVAALGFFAVGVVVPVLAARFGGSRGLEYRTQAGALSAFVLDSLRGLGELLQYDAGQRRLDELDERTGSLLATEKKMKTALGTATACTGALIWLFSLAMLAAVDPSVVTVRTIPARVECGGTFCRGMVVADLREHPIEAPGVSICVDVDSRRALEELIIEGPANNIDLLHQILHHPDFVRGNYSTGFLEANMDTLLAWSGSGEVGKA